MARIIPWTLPPVNGGSQGGYTPQPTPSPVQEYYNVENVTITRSSPASGSKSGVCYAKISGIETVDITGVASIAFVSENAYSLASQAAADSATKALDTGFTSNSADRIASPNGNLPVTHNYLSSDRYWAVGKVMLFVYNGNGEILATYTLTDNLDGA